MYASSFFPFHNRAPKESREDKDGNDDHPTKDRYPHRSRFTRSRGVLSSRKDRFPSYSRHSSSRIPTAHHTPRTSRTGSRSSSPLSFASPFKRTRFLILFRNPEVSAQYDECNGYRATPHTRYGAFEWLRVDSEEMLEWGYEGYDEGEDSDVEWDCHEFVEGDEEYFHFPPYL
jgi:hypothetical protein